ncbi:SPW repeat protein [Streptomyces griseochromogenes]|uniref:SPW repeat protein n=1 Tax=Streptomyces griseochromogenes TaxID=68214 RepID=UPI0037A3BC53
MAHARHPRDATRRRPDHVWVGAFPVFGIRRARDHPHPPPGGVALLALKTPLAPHRMHRLAWTMVPLGLWLILSPAVVTASHGVSPRILWSNTCTGVTVCLLGLIAANRAPDASG